MPSRAVIPTTVTAALCLLLSGARPAEPAQGYQYFVVGNPADVVTPTSGCSCCRAGARMSTRTSCGWALVPAAATSS
jgi:hypothetical protein